MKFKEWIRKLEEAAKAASPTTRFTANPSSVTKPDMTSYRGVPYGWEKTQIPYSKSFDNPGVIAVPAGIGAGVDSEMKKSGREFSPSVRVSEFPTELNPLVMHGSLPLQYPMYIEINPDETRNEVYLFTRSSNYISGLNFQNVSKSLQLNLGRIRTLDNNPEDWDEPNRFILFSDETRFGGRETDFNDLEVAKLFTRYAIQTLITNDMLDQNEDIINRYNIMKPTLEYETLTDNVLVCVFTFKPTNEGLPNSIRGDE
jgi:hypothetical protein